MCEAGFHDEVDVTVGVKPIEECVHVRVDAWSGRRLKVDALLANRTGNDLHWPVAIVAPRSYPDFAHAATTSWEKRCMPGKQPVSCKRLVIVTCRVEHHLNDAFHVAVSRFKASYVHS